MVAMRTDDQRNTQVGLERATRLLTVDEVCEQLSLSRGKVNQLTTAGLLKAVKIGRSKRIRTADLDTFIEELGNATD